MSTNIPRTTLITGAASGMGAALSRHLTALGERVIGVDLSNADICADLADPSQRATLVARVEQITPAVDAVVACAGVSPPVAGDTLLSVNYFGVADLLPRLLPLLHRATQPRAVVISSLASIHPVDTRLVEMCLDGDELAARQQAAKIGALCYASSKRALTQWIRRTAVLSGWADQGVLLNGIAPGVVKTPMVAPLLASASRPASPPPCVTMQAPSRLFRSLHFSLARPTAIWWARFRSSTAAPMCSCAGKPRCNTARSDKAPTAPSSARLWFAVRSCPRTPPTSESLAEGAAGTGRLHICLASSGSAARRGV